MIAQQNDDILAAGNAVYRLTQEERIRQICEAREDYYRCQRGMQRFMEEQVATVKRQEAILKEQEVALKEQEVALKEQAAALKEQANALKEQANALNEKDSALTEKDSLIATLLAEKEQLEKKLTGN